MASIKQWNEAIEILSIEDRKKFQKAIDELRSWLFFEKEFMPTELFAVSNLLEVETEIDM